MVDPACDVKLKYRALVSHGFSSEQAQSMLTAVPSVLSQPLNTEFKERLRLGLEKCGRKPFTQYSSGKGLPFLGCGFKPM